MDLARRIPIIGVMGSGSEPHSKNSTQLGKWIAEAGYHLLTGGGGGVMSAVSKSFFETENRKGLSIGIIPGNVDENGYKSLKHYPNPWIEIPIYTHLPLSGSDGISPLSRNHINILSAHLIVALPGSQGTKSEIQLSLKYKKPVLGFFQKNLTDFDKNLEIECFDSFDDLTLRINEILGK